MKKMGRLLAHLIEHNSADQHFTSTFNGSNAFMIAVREKLDCAEKMLPKVKNLGQKRSDGKNALMIALYYHNFDMANKILDYYPMSKSPQIERVYPLSLLDDVDNLGQNALNYAIQTKNKHIIQRFMAHLRV